ncbi:MAG: VOC family protein [Ilumatobacteraceae bacterium]
MARSYSFTDPYHLGVVVPHLESAMDEITAAQGVTWASLQDRQQSLWTPELGDIRTRLRFTYSCEGPLHIELLQGEAGTFWDDAVWHGLQHTGVWSDDVAGETEALAAAGWELVGAQRSPQDGYGSFTYLRGAGGFILELVTSAARPRFEQWWAGGSL